MNRDDLIANIENMTLGLDDTFKFHCTRCGMCCVNREDIILSPMDIYKMAKELKLTPTKFFVQFCQVHIGDNSRLPIIRFLPVGEEMRCPMLKDHKCRVHKVKPSVCALYPLGRYTECSKDDPSAAMNEVKCLLQPIECGDSSREHTVREWLSDFDIKSEDEAFIRWNQTVAEVGTKIKTLEKTWDMITMMQVWFMVRVFLYEHYDTGKPFAPQFEENVGFISEMLEDIPRMKALLKSIIGT